MPGYCTVQVHFARANNLADVAAKESSQETAVTLVGLLSGLLVASYVDLTVAQSWAFFGLLTAVHVFANLRYVRVHAGLSGLRWRLSLPTLAQFHLPSPTHNFCPRYRVPV